MEKNNQPLILGIVAIGAVLIIALALIFTRGSDETAPETAVTDDISENREDPTPDPNPDPIPPEPQPTPEPQPEPAPEPEPSNGLPSNWLSLTSQQKTDLNPFDCNHAIQWVSADDGSCIAKPTDPKPEPPDYVLLDTNCYDPPIDPPHFIVCDISLATTSNDNLEQFLAEIVLPTGSSYAEEVWVRADVYEYNGSDNLSEYAEADSMYHATEISNPDYWDDWDDTL